MAKIKLSLSSYRQFEQNPCFKAIQKIFEDIYYKDAGAMLHNVNLRQTPDQIALEIAQNKGKQMAISPFIHRTEDSNGRKELKLKLDILNEENIEWEP